jgi:putative Mg2+ transporter-C (MgtC) family protein
MLVSKYGFTDILADGRVVLDPSRVAAKIVSGIGFIGGGVIFVRKDLVRGLTTATTIWATSAVGMACDAGLPLLAIAVTCANFVVVFGFPLLERELPKSRWEPSSLQVSYKDGRGILRDIQIVCTQLDFAVTGPQWSAMVNPAETIEASSRARAGQGKRPIRPRPALSQMAYPERNRHSRSRTARGPIRLQARWQAERNRWRVPPFGRRGHISD